MSDRPTKGDDDFTQDIASRYEHHETTAPAAASDATSAPGGALVINGLDDQTRERFNLAATARGLTPADYLTALVQLHEAMRLLVDRATHPEVDQTLRQLQLGSVKV